MSEGLIDVIRLCHLTTLGTHSAAFLQEWAGFKFCSVSPGYHSMSVSQIAHQTPIGCELASAEHQS